MIQNKEYINILVDYDNLAIKSSDIQSAIEHIASRILSQLKIDNSTMWYEANFRLYGGWYDSNVLTRKAEEITTILQDKFPVILNCYNCKINVELSKSMLSQPSKDLLSTYRKRKGLSRLRVCKMNDVCCSNVESHMRYVKKLLRNKRCPECGASSENLLWCSEQKLVDVMLAMDLSFLAMSEQEAHLSVVSSDDDFVPAIFQVCYLGKKVFHMHAKQNFSLNPLYQAIAPMAFYKEIAF